MRVLVTGGSGWVGTHLIPLLVARGHTVLALARSDASASKIKALVPGSEDKISIVTGTLTDLDVLTQSAQSCDAVIHLAFSHDDMSKFQESIAMDIAALKALAAGLKNGSSTNKALIATGGSGNLDGTITDENFRSQGEMRGAAENFVVGLADEGIRGINIRLGNSVHGKGDAHGLVPSLIAQAKRLGYAMYIEGATWGAVSVDDAAELYALALEKGEPGHVYHGVPEVVTIKGIAEAIAKGTGLEAKAVTPPEAQQELGFLGIVLGFRFNLTSELTQAQLGWKPKGATLFEDMEAYYFA